MSRTRLRPYSRYTREAAALLGKLVTQGRKRRKLSAQDLAARAGISRGTLRKIERGDPSAELGLAFEVAAIVGVRLFNAGPAALAAHTARIDEALSLLPKSVHSVPTRLDDDF